MSDVSYLLPGVTVFWSQLQFFVSTVRSETGKRASPDLPCSLLGHIGIVLTKGLGSGTATNLKWLLVHVIRKANDLSWKKNITLVFPFDILQMY